MKSRANTRASIAILLATLLFTAATASFAPTSLQFQNQSTLVLSNGFLSLTMSLASPTLTALHGDLSGTAKFTVNSLSAPIALSRTVAGQTCTSSLPTKYTIVTNTSAKVTIQLTVNECDTSPIVTEKWLLSLTPDSRSLTFNISGVTNAATTTVQTVRRVIPINAPSVYSFFDRGVVQMMNTMGLSHAKTFFFARNHLHRLYGLGSGSSIDMAFSNETTDSSTLPLANVMLVGKTVELQQIILGNTTVQDQWTTASWSTPITWNKGQTYATNIQLTPNNYNFPSGGLSTGPNLPEKDLISIMIGMYASAPGNLCTYDNEVVANTRVAQIATTIATPTRGYQDTYNYFDPDNFIALSSMLYTGDDFLQSQARDVIMRSGAYLNKTTGQLPHHFNKDQPTYLALSGATQTGPNIFWTKTALRYAANTGDMEWLKNYLPTLRNASDFCFDLIDSDLHLIDAPGSLMIDVFIRANYTSDSNSMMVGFLTDFAAVERQVGSIEKAKTLEQKSKEMATAMNKWLWDAEDNDHYITQLDTDMKTTRDFVDYDSNLIALAHDIPATVAQKQAILSRIDRGKCSAANGGGPQWVSEVYYGKNDTTGGNIGDSRCSMGRIAWFDGHARKKMNTKASLEQFNRNVLLLQNDLIANTWLHERYGCDGKQQQNRTNYYFEYPSTLVLLLREIRYGIDIAFQTVTIQPFGVETFTYNIGNVYVQYEALKSVALQVPGSRTVKYIIHGMSQDQRYQIKVGGERTVVVQGGKGGVLTFNGETGCVVEAVVLL